MTCGQREIFDKIRSMDLADVSVQIGEGSVDCQPTLAGAALMPALSASRCRLTRCMLADGVAVLVTGTMSVRKQPARRFVQSFVLAPQPKGALRVRAQPAAPAHPSNCRLLRAERCPALPRCGCVRQGRRASSRLRPRRCGC